MDKMKAREAAKHNHQIYNYVKSKIGNKNQKKRDKHDSDKNKPKTFNLENPWKHNERCQQRQSL